MLKRLFVRTQRGERPHIVHKLASLGAPVALCVIMGHAHISESLLGTNYIESCFFLLPLPLLAEEASRSEFFKALLAVVDRRFGLKI